MKKNFTRLRQNVQIPMANTQWDKCVPTPHLWACHLNTAWWMGYSMSVTLLLLSPLFNQSFFPSVVALNIFIPFLLPPFIQAVVFVSLCIHLSLCQCLGAACLPLCFLHSQSKWIAAFLAHECYKAIKMWQHLGRLQFAYNNSSVSS